VGQPFTERGWTALKGGLHDRLYERGYAEVEVDGQALVDVENHQAALDVAVRPGERYRFGDIDIDTGGAGRSRRTGSARRCAWRSRRRCLLGEALAERSAG